MLFDASAVDVVALTPDGTTVELYVVADAPWTGSDSQIRSLQDKLHAYVGFACDGQLAASYPDAADKPWRIVVNCRSGPPDRRTSDLLDRTIAPIRRYGGDLEIRRT